MIATMLVPFTLAMSAQTRDWISQMPAHMVLHAPFTPFTSNLSLNATEHVVERLAAQASAMGANVIFVGGSMGQFDTLSTAERKTLATAWARAGPPLGLYVIAHVGSNVQAEAIDLARHAACEPGIAAIASVPHYYETPSSASDIIDFLRPIADAAPEKPLFYYHIPSVTGVDVKVAQLFSLAASNETQLPQLAGVKYVSDDPTDWFDLVAAFNTSRALLWAPEPKLQSFALGLGRGAVLAEDFFAPTYLRMHAAYVGGHGTAASAVMRREQAWKLRTASIFGKYGGQPAERAAYVRLCAHVDLGPPRPPKRALPAADWPKLETELDAVGFWAEGPSQC